ncbi:MAG: DUF2752 domain-containing protein [Acidimicrobiales bacterium]
MTTAAPPAPQSSRYARPLGFLAGAVLLAPTLLRPDAGGPVLCPFRRVTGVWCPTCGMTRAVAWMAHGDLHQSLRYHPLAPLLLIEAVLGAAFLWYRHRAHRDDPAWVPFGFLRSHSPQTLLRALIVANALLVLAVWVIRVKSGSFDDLG